MTLRLVSKVEDESVIALIECPICKIANKGSWVLLAGTESVKKVCKPCAEISKTTKFNLETIEQNKARMEKERKSKNDLIIQELRRTSKRNQRKR